MDSPRERLESSKQKIRAAPGNETAQRPVQSEVNVDCAIEITEALISLEVAVADMADRTALVAGNFIRAIEKATEQAEISSRESTAVAKESATLSRRLNKLTLWIILAALLSALATVVQSVAAVREILKG
jgi:hypothetical protein